MQLSDCLDDCIQIAKVPNFNLIEWSIGTWEFKHLSASVEKVHLKSAKSSSMIGMHSQKKKKDSSSVDLVINSLCMLAES